MPRKVFADTQIIADLLTHGPITARQLMRRIARAESTVSMALRRLQQHGLVQITGRGARTPDNIRGHVPAVWDVGPAVRLWALRNVKPKATEDE